MKFSIVTPSYNQGQFISQTIDSVINQKGDFDIEYFVYDGGSTDDTVNILKKYEKKLINNHRIKFYWQSKKDKGQSNAINQALSRATGDIFAYINSDDYYQPKTFDIVYNHFKKNPKCQWLVGDCHVSDQRLSWTFWLKQIWPIQYFKSALQIFNTINQPSVFLKKTLAKKVGIFNEKYHYSFDYDYWLRCLEISLPCRTTSTLSTFRIHDNSKGNLQFRKQFDEDWLVFNKYKTNFLVWTIHLIAIKFTKFMYSFLK